MIENYTADFYVKAAYDLDAKALKKLGIALVLVDLDNTLIAWNQPEGTPELRAWLGELRAADIQICVVSNNHYKRVKTAVAPFGVDFVNDALKPFTWGIKKALKRYSVSTDKVLLVGDQRMTDIRAGKRAGIRTVLVKPLLVSDHWQTQFNRWRERRVTRKIEATQGKTIYKDKIE
ncbi:MAG: YqeG family HAD IIIA-type phosphatase [Streptococcaceae bacterium]|jgi:HAD superfamily phosphatase (TIGR01668 family)|nr:YqeG family HAD IIIA-type phosphatase [Streptococcaceae bacterium]